MSQRARCISGGECARVVSSMCEPDGTKDGVEPEEARFIDGLRLEAHAWGHPSL